MTADTTLSDQHFLESLVTAAKTAGRTPTDVATSGSVTYNVKTYGAKGDGSTDDTAAIQSAFTAMLVTPGTLYFPNGTYTVTGLVLASASNFRLTGAPKAVIQLQKASASKPTVAQRDVLIVADCTNFLIDNLTFDGNREQKHGTAADWAPADQYLTADAASGQPTVTVEDASRYFVGQYLTVMGGLTANGGTEKNNQDTRMLVQSVNVGAGTVTFTTNLGHTYTHTGAAGGAFVTAYQTGTLTTNIAGRTSLASENCQNGLHLLNCQYFGVRDCTAKNTWESGFKVGVGFDASQLTDACSYGIFDHNTATNGYDQGVSVWNSRSLVITNNFCQNAGWAGISLTGSSDCIVSGNDCEENIYRVPNDNNSGTGIAIEGGEGNVVTNNRLRNNWSKGVNLAPNPQTYGLNTGSPPTNSAACSPGDTSITVSTSAAFVANGYYAICDDVRTENFIVLTITDGTHIALDRPLRFRHETGKDIGPSATVDNVISDNALSWTNSTYGASTVTGVQCVGGPRNRIDSNEIVRATVAGVQVSSTTVGSCVYNASATAVTNNAITATSAVTGQQGGVGSDIYVNTVDECLIQGNQCSANNNAGGGGAIRIKAANSVTVSDNQIDDPTTYGIYVSNTCKRPKVIGNTVRWAKNEGIRVENADNGIFANNHAYSCNAIGIRIMATTHSQIIGNHAISNAGTGIKLDDNGGVGTTYCVCALNVARDDGTGTNNLTGGALTQGTSISEGTNGNNNSVDYNQVDHTITLTGGASTQTGTLVN